ncbi:MAG: class I SAM-dependent methyltransferase [Proteobacteria bacterium]|nr:class I SAM-dependent methyltransferase [Pseudomonadota bacterium]
MAQITSGWRALLSSPKVYDAFQNLMGGRRRGTFVEEFIRPHMGARLLDIGCGTAQLLEFLPGDATYVGYDPSPEYIAHARYRYGDRGEFHLGQFNAAEAAASQPFDLVTACGVLHHLDDIQAQELIALARRVLLPGGRFISIDPTYSKDQNWFSYLLVSRDRGQNVRFGQEYDELAKPYFREINGTLRHRRWIPYTHWIMECEV